MYICTWTLLNIRNSHTNWLTSWERRLEAFASQKQSTPRRHQSRKPRSGMWITMMDPCSACRGDPSHPYQSLPGKGNENPKRRNKRTPCKTPPSIPRKPTYSQNPLQTNENTSLKLTCSPLKTGRAPKGKDHRLQPQGLSGAFAVTVSFREATWVALQK